MANKSIISYIKQNILNQHVQQEEEPKTFAFVDYNYLDVQDLDADTEYGDFISKMNVWQLSDPEKIEFMNKNIKPEFLENTIFAIVLDFTKPWEFMDELSKWGDVVFEINKKFLQLPANKQAEMKKKVENHFKFYVNPAKEGEVGFSNEENKEDSNLNEEEMKEAIDEMQIDNGVQFVNIHIPFVII